MQKQVFRQYDIRGKIGTEVTIDDFYDITHAFLFFLKQQQDIKAIAVGMDGRLHSQEISQQVIKACKEAGVDIYFLGVCSTPMISFAYHHFQIQASIMITASHNPADYNGLKLLYQKNSIQGEKLQQIYELSAIKVRSKGVFEGVLYHEFNFVDLYIESFMVEFAHLKNILLPDCFIDCGNGVAGPILIKLIDAMGWKFIQLLCVEVDGNYPHHLPDPTDEDNIQILYSHVLKHTGSFGIGLDGDCDRFSVVTSQQGLIRSDTLLTIFAQSIRSEVLVADIKSSNVVYHAGSKVILSPTGCSYIMQTMKQHKALVAGELSGHFFFQDRHEGYDDGIYAMLRFFEILVQSNGDSNRLFSVIPQFFATKEIRIPCSDDYKFHVVDQITKHLATNYDYTIITVDGVRFQTDRSWSLIRASNTQPMLSICSQADSLDTLQVSKKFLIQLLQPYIHDTILKQYII